MDKGDRGDKESVEYTVLTAEILSLADLGRDSDPFFFLPKLREASKMKEPAITMEYHEEHELKLKKYLTSRIQELRM